MIDDRVHTCCNCHRIIKPGAWYNVGLERSEDVEGNISIRVRIRCKDCFMVIVEKE